VLSVTDRITDVDKLAIIEGMALASVRDNDPYGEYWQAFIVESSNRLLAEQKSIRWRNTS